MPYTEITPFDAAQAIHRPQRSSTRFPGIVRHAEALGCSRIHLYLVLTGQRQSPDLIRRYHALLNRQDIIDSTLAQRLDQLMQSLDWTQVRAAEAFGLSQSTVSQILSGTIKSISAEAALRIARATGCDLVWLIDGTLTSKTDSLSVLPHPTHP